MLCTFRSQGWSVLASHTRPAAVVTTSPEQAAKGRYQPSTRLVGAIPGASWAMKLKNSSGTLCSTTVSRKHTDYCLQCISTLGESLYEVLEQPSASGPPGVRTATSIAAKKKPK